MDVSDLNMTEIRNTISNLTNIEADKLRIQVVTNDKDEIIRIIVIADDEATADTIRDILNEAIDEHKQDGIIRHFKNVKVAVKEKELSLSCGMKKDEKMITIAASFVLLLFHFHLLW